MEKDLKKIYMYIYIFSYQKYKNIFINFKDFFK